MSTANATRLSKAPGKQQHSNQNHHKAGGMPVTKRQFGAARAVARMIRSQKRDVSFAPIRRIAERDVIKVG
jgi:SLT domain-containing protein